MEAGYLVMKAGSRWNGKVSPALAAKLRRERFTTLPDCLLGGAGVPAWISALSYPLIAKQAERKMHFNCFVWQEQTQFSSGARRHAAGGGDAGFHR